MRHDRGNPDTVRVKRPDWLDKTIHDFAWLSVQAEYVQRAGIDRDPTVELVMTHPGIPPGTIAQIHGVRAEHGPLALSIRKKDTP